jgi:malonate transporter
MISAFSGFALIGVIVLAGWLTQRYAGLPDNAEAVLGRLVYSVLAPCLLFTGAARADPTVLFSEPLLVSTAAAVTCFALFTLLARGRAPGPTIMGALASGYTNANYIGIPVATYVLGDATLVVPIVILQLLVITPVALTLLEITTTGHTSWRTVLTTPLRNPLVAAVALGAVLAGAGWHLPAVLGNPVAAIGQAAVPVVLIAFGMSLSGRGVLTAGSDRTATLLAVTLKTAAMPAIAYLIARLLGLPHDATFAVTVLAALPTAQNVFLYGQRFDTGVDLVRDAIFLSTLACAPTLLLITFLFHR